MGLQVSASNTDLLLACQRPFSPDVDLDEDKRDRSAANYGTAFHSVMQVLRSESASREIDLRFNGPEYAGVIEHALIVDKFLTSWLAGGNSWGAELLVEATEQPRATKIAHNSLGIKTRPTTLDTATHTYALRPREFGGTFDLLVESLDKQLRVVIDYKTGDYGAFDRPSELGQLRTLAIQTGANAVAILHAPRGFPPTMYAEDFSEKQAKTHIRNLKRALGRIGDGSLRPGTHCARCPAKLSCPAKDGELLKSASSLVRGANTKMAGDTNPGKLHMLLSEFERLATRARADLRERVRRGEVIERPDGKVLEMTTVEVERLSKSSVYKALGSAQGDKEIDRLRALGCIPKSEEERMVAK